MIKHDQIAQLTLLSLYTVLLFVLWFIFFMVLIICTIFPHPCALQPQVISCCFFIASHYLSYAVHFIVFQPTDLRFFSITFFPFFTLSVLYPLLHFNLLQSPVCDM